MCVWVPLRCREHPQVSSSIFSCQPHYLIPHLIAVESEPRKGFVTCGGRARTRYNSIQRTPSASRSLVTSIRTSFETYTTARTNWHGQLTLVCDLGLKLAALWWYLDCDVAEKILVLKGADTGSLAGLSR